MRQRREFGGGGLRDRAVGVMASAVGLSFNVRGGLLRFAVARSFVGVLG